MAQHTRALVLIETAAPPSSPGVSGPRQAAPVPALDGPWPMRAAWLVQAVLVGPAVADALGDASAPVQYTATVGLWTAWAAVLVAALVPSTASLTVVRVAGPAALAVAVAAAVQGPVGADDIMALLGGVVAAVAALAPTTTDAFVDGSSYGNERRLALATPTVLRLVAAPLAWLLTVGLPPSAALALAARQWVPGVALVVLAIGALRLTVPALHRLSRRWLVFVPAGVVVHDPVALAEPVLLRRNLVLRIGPAAAGDAGDALDLTAGAAGLVIEIALHEPAELALPPPGPRHQGRPEVVRATRLLVTPLRPGALLAVARDRRLPVG